MARIGGSRIDLASDSWLRTDAAATYDALKADPSLAIRVENVRAGFETKWAAFLTGRINYTPEAQQQHNDLDDQIIGSRGVLGSAASGRRSWGR